MTVQRFASDDEAIAMANDVRYGLASSVFSENVGRALKVAAELDFGCVWINEHLFPLTPEMPHGGFKESGYGKDMSHVLDGGVHAAQARLREAGLGTGTRLSAQSPSRSGQTDAVARRIGSERGAGTQFRFGAAARTVAGPRH